MMIINFTVLMCTYKKDDPFLLEKAVDSVFNNSIKPNFFILTIDGPIPQETQRIVNKLRVKYTLEINILKENLGLARALNSAIPLVKTEWIARADSDDLNFSNRFEKQIKYAKKGFDVIGSNIYEIDIYETIQLPRLRKIMPIHNKEIKRFARFRNPMNHMTTFYRADAVKLVGGYPNIYLREDYGLWAKLICNNNKFININECLVCVNGGNQLYLRRRGFRNVLGEMKLQVHLFKNNVQPLYLALFLFILRFSLLLLPKNIIKILYIKILRK
ncbi:MAG: glycosyltransferase [Pelagibacteraceae bacterium TMED124]|nr:MAG: glycosyltransferase [Pelagibacteraceae bacterium TMED124]